jgi:hypothetical protein
MNKDLNHLKLLGILHTVWGILAILCGLLFGIMFIVLGANPSVEISGNMSPEAAHGFFMLVGAVAVGLSSIYGILMLVAGGKLRKQRGYGFCFFVAILDLFGFPGIILGIFTLIVLLRPTVKQLFKGGAPLPPITPAQVVSPVA